MANLKFITLDQMMASVEADLSTYADEGMIDRGKVIKVVRKINEDLGLKIYREGSTILDIQNYKADLPLDFRFLQLAVACSVQEFGLAGSTVMGTHTVEHQACELPTETYNNLNACINEQGGCYWVTQQFRDKTVKYHNLVPLRITSGSTRFCDNKCINGRWSNSGYEIDIDGECGQAVTNFKEGKVYISYTADLVDENNNILVLDHPLTTEYYEYAIKKALLEMWFINKQVDIAQALQYIKGELRESRIRALNFVNTVEYTEIQDLFRANRDRFYNRYNRMFDGY